MVGQFESFNCKCPSKTIINKVGHIREISFCSLPCFYFLLIFKQKAMADNQEPEPILLHEDTHQKDLISLLGTQGLMYNDYNAAEYKLLMLIIKHNQTVI